MPERADPARRMLLSVDARGFGAAPGRRQRVIQDGLLAVLDDAARRAGLSRDEWDRQEAGDGELAVLPAGVDEPRVVEDFPRELYNALRGHNRDFKQDLRLRLRLAVHYGPAVKGPYGYTHEGPVTVSRLCDAAPLKDALAASGADLAVIFSQVIYQHPIGSEDTLLDLEKLRKVRVVMPEKKFDQDAWIWIPGHDAPPPATDEPPDGGVASTPGPPRDTGTGPFDGVVISPARFRDAR